MLFLDFDPPPFLHSSLSDALSYLRSEKRAFLTEKKDRESTQEDWVNQKSRSILKKQSHLYLSNGILFIRRIQHDLYCVGHSMKTSCMSTKIVSKPRSYTLKVFNLVDCFVPGTNLPIFSLPIACSTIQRVPRYPLSPMTFSPS